jgi:hypothetical protein
MKVDRALIRSLREAGFVLLPIEPDKATLKRYEFLRNISDEVGPRAEWSDLVKAKLEADNDDDDTTKPGPPAS